LRFIAALPPLGIAIQDVTLRRLEGRHQAVGRVVSIFHYRDGRQAERWFYPEDPDVWDRILDA
jgi:hypothetical protein